VPRPRQRCPAHTRAPAHAETSHTGHHETDFDCSVTLGCPAKSRLRTLEPPRGPASPRVHPCCCQRRHHTPHNTHAVHGHCNMLHITGNPTKNHHLTLIGFSRRDSSGIWDGIWMGYGWDMDGIWMGCGWDVDGMWMGCGWDHVDWMGHTYTRTHGHTDRLVHGGL
jgi:hypothetical protein